MYIKPEKMNSLLKMMERLGIKEDDLEEKFIIGSGRGGQKLQKTHSCVYLKHIPTGLEVKCQKERSREFNRYYARKELCDKLAAILFKEESKKEQEFEKIRRQKRRKSRKQKQKMFENKKALSAKKELRKSPDF